MKALKHMAGIALATAGLSFWIGALILMFDRESDVPPSGAILFFIVLGIIPLGGAVALLRGPFTEPPRPCPQCGGTKHRAAGVHRSVRGLWEASREREVCCLTCNTRYLTATKASRIAGILFWILLLMILFRALIQLFQEGW
jgi:hypothetical protein